MKDSEFENSKEALESYWGVSTQKIVKAVYGSIADSLGRMANVSNCGWRNFAIADILPVWTLPLLEAKAGHEKYGNPFAFAEPTGQYHIQVECDSRIEVFARTAPREIFLEDQAICVESVIVSVMANRIEQALQALETYPYPPRLLNIPERHLSVLWWHRENELTGSKDKLFIVHQITPLPEEAHSEGEGDDREAAQEADAFQVNVLSVSQFQDILFEEDKAPDEIE